MCFSYLTSAHTTHAHDGIHIGQTRSVNLIQLFSCMSVGLVVSKWANGATEDSAFRPFFIKLLVRGASPSFPRL